MATGTVTKFNGTRDNLLIRTRTSSSGSLPLSLAFNLCCLPGNSLPVLSGVSP